MLDPKKTELMSRAAVYEQGHFAEKLKLRTYYENKKKIFMTGTGLIAAFSYAAILSIVCLFIYDKVNISALSTLSIILLITAVVCLGVLFVVIYMYLIKRFVSVKYRNVRSSLVRYDLIKKKMLAADGEDIQKTGIQESAKE